jgi:hypothetical protein
MLLGTYQSKATPMQISEDNAIAIQSIPEEAQFQHNRSSTPVVTAVARVVFGTALARVLVSHPGLSYLHLAKRAYPPGQRYSR